MRSSKRVGGFSARRAEDRRQQQFGQQGFTLVEMLVVITIIGLIMGLIGPRVLNYLSESKVKAAKIQLQSFGSALDLFYLDAGRFPSTAEGLAALVRRTPGVAAWNGPYLKGGNVPNDPWNNAYLYRSPGDRGPYDIMSYGSDGQEGGCAAAVHTAQYVPLPPAGLCASGRDASEGGPQRGDSARGGRRHAGRCRSALDPVGRERGYDPYSRRRPLRGAIAANLQPACGLVDYQLLCQRNVVRRDHRADPARCRLRNSRQLADRKDRNCLPQLRHQLTVATPASRSSKC